MRQRQTVWLSRGMKKRLSVLGNSLALVIDKPMRALLGIGRDTILQVSTDGRRILIEPTGELYASVMTATEVDALRVMDTLLQFHGLGQGEFEQLCPCRMRMFAYRGAVMHGAFDDDIRIVMKRLEVCLRQRIAAAPWELAIRAALDEIPALAA